MRHKEKFVMSTIVDIACPITYEKGVSWFLNSFSQSARSHHTFYLFLQCDFIALSVLYFAFVLFLSFSRSLNCHSLSLQPQFVPLLVFDHKIFLKCSSISFTLRSLFLTPDSLSLSSKNTRHYRAQSPPCKISKCCNVIRCYSTFGAKYHLITLLKFKQYFKVLTENNKTYFHFKANVNDAKSAY